MTSLKILIAGDYSPRERASVLIDENRYNDLFKEMLPFTEEADISIVNFETTVVDEECLPIEKRGPNLKCTEKAIDALQYAGFNCVTLANNHFRDYGDRGCELSFAAFEKKGIDYVGAGTNIGEAKRILYKTVRGKTIAICNFCEHEFTIAEEDKKGCNPIDPVSNYYQITEAKSKADCVIIITHGGHEHFQYPSLRMKKLFHYFIDLGADAVINHHQHCYSGYEEYNGKPIFYGLGNFCFDWQYTDLWTKGVFVTISIKDKVISTTTTPYRQWGQEQTGVRILQGKDKQEVLDDMNRISSVISNDLLLEEVCNGYFDKTQIPYAFSLEPVYNKYLRSLYIRGLYPTKLNRRRLIDLLLYLQCESHFERVIRFLKRKNKE